MNQVMILSLFIHLYRERKEDLIKTLKSTNHVINCCNDSSHIQCHWFCHYTCVKYSREWLWLSADEPLRKPVPLHEQTVKDEKGRYQRFHGAFTGGFSAGYFNTVGSKEGQWSTWIIKSWKISDQESYCQLTILLFLKYISAWAIWRHFSLITS